MKDIASKSFFLFVFLSLLRFSYLLSGLDHGLSKGKDAFQPISCRSLLKQIKNNELEVSDPNGGLMHARQTITSPKFWVSLHKQEFDGLRWGIMKSGLYYEKVLMDCFAKVLREAPARTRVVDVGGNIGFFSLLSASVRPVAVDAFEPNMKNVLRFCESLSLNRWYSEYEVAGGEPTLDSYVNLFPYGVGEKSGKAVFRENRNPGMGSFANVEAENNESKLQVVSLDDVARQKGWFTSRPHIAILKVDVEGYEIKVFEGAKEFLKAQIVRNIFMEVSGRNQQEQQDTVALMQIIQSLGYRLYKYGEWSGPDILCNWPNDESLPLTTLNYTLSTRNQQANLWWVLRKE